LAGERPRVLLECPPEASPFVVADVLERAGFEVEVCEGPTDRAACPLTTGGSCPAVEGADVVVNLLGMGPEHGAEVLSGVRDTYPQVPVVVEVPAPLRAHHGAELAGVRVATSPVTAAALVEHIWAAVEDHSTGDQV
jgi:hypothetical protein